MAENPKFDPNRADFRECIEAVEKALETVHLKMGADFLTSRDQYSAKLRKQLGTDNLPDDQAFQKWQLPFILDRTNWFVTVAAPGAVTPKHSHDQGAGVRFILGGSVTINGVDYHGGDWLYLPAGTPYDYVAGPMGAIIMAGYQC